MTFILSVRLPDRPGRSLPAEQRFASADEAHAAGREVALRHRLESCEWSVARMGGGEGASDASA